MARLSPSLETEIGTVGYPGLAYGGFPYDPSEQTAELTWPLSVYTYDRMRRQDAQVASTMRACTFPIRRALWQLDGTDCAPAVVQHIAEDLGLNVMGQAPTRRRRSSDRFSFDEHLRQALLSLSYGHMGFEQVYRIVDGKARLHKLSPRMPVTLAKINVDEATGDLVSIDQYTGIGEGKSRPIPADRLVWYANDMEGASWQGVSLLRPCFRDYLLKDRLTRVNAMTMERNGMGVPVAEAAPGAIGPDLALLEQVMQNWRAGEQSGAAVPFGTKVRLVGVSGSLPNIVESIRYHDEQIAGALLAGFLKLGAAKGANRALGEVFVDFFRLALDAIAGQLQDAMNAHVIEDIVDLNYGPDEPAPKIVVSQTDVQVDLTPDALVQLVRAGIITSDEALETEQRQRYRLPERSDPGGPRTGVLPGVPLSQPGFSAATDPRGRLPFAASTPSDGLPAGESLPEPLGTIYRRRHALETTRNASLAAALPVWRASVDLTAVLTATGIVRADSTQPVGPDPRAIAAEVAAEQALTASLATNAGQALRDTAHTGLVQSYAEGQTGARQLVSVTRGQIGVDLAAMTVDFATAVAAADNLDSLWTEADAWLADHVGVVSRALGDAVGQALTDGTGRDELLGTLEGVIDDAGFAEVLYDHAMATALGQGAADLYQSENVASVDWSTAGDSRVDQICETYETNSPYALASAPSVPAHVNCRCSLMPSDDAIRALLAPASEGLSTE